MCVLFWQKYKLESGRHQTYTSYGGETEYGHQHHYDGGYTNHDEGYDNDYEGGFDYKGYGYDDGNDYDY